MMSMPQLSGSFSSSSDKVGAAAAEQLGEHFAEIDPHLRESFGEKFLGRAVDPGDDVEQFAARGRQIVVLGFEETVALFQFVVFVDRVEIHRTHVVELAGEFGNDLREISTSSTLAALRELRLRRQLLSSRRASPPSLSRRLSRDAQCFLEREMIRREVTQVDLISPHHMFRQVFDAQLQLRLANLLFAAKIAQIIE